MEFLYPRQFLYHSHLNVIALLIVIFVSTVVFNVRNYFVLFGPPKMGKWQRSGNGEYILHKIFLMLRCTLQQLKNSAQNPGGWI